MQISLIGPRLDGKTSFFAALHAEYQRSTIPYMITDDDLLDHAARQGLHDQVSFSIKRYKHEQDRQLLDNLADGLRHSPIIWPDKTFDPDYFPVDVVFRSWSLQGDRKSEREKRLQLTDVPGEAFRTLSDTTEMSDTVKTSLTMSTASQALVVFFSVEKLLSGEYKEYTDRIGTIISKASSVAGFKYLFPVTFVFSKFDVIPVLEWEARHRMFFDNIVAPISSENRRILAMSCPLSMTMQSKNLFKPMNLQYPFLFSAMGIIFAQNLAKQQMAEDRRAANWWKRFTQMISTRETAGSMEAEARRDLSLAHSIIDTLHLDTYFNRTNLRFCQNGEEVFLSDIRRGMQ